MGTDLKNLQRKTSGLGAKVRWHVNNFLIARPRLLELFRSRLTVFDAFGAPGDTLLTAIVCRHVKQCYPSIRINLLTPNPGLVSRDPNIDEINSPESYICLWSWYLDHVEQKNLRCNILEPIFKRLRIRDHEFRARVFLDDGELKAAASLVAGAALPVLAFNTLSKEPVKNWSLDSWLALVEKLRAHFELVHIGDDREPLIPGVQRFAGRLDMRQSMALLAAARLHVGPDSFLMHAANGLGVPSVIIYGGSRPPEATGYAENINLFVEMPCGPCWIHENRGEHCTHDIECLKKISVDDVHQAVMRLARTRHVLPPE